jgi:ubiquinone/menaquinone biosynthesis C-methylase UbiE
MEETHFDTTTANQLEDAGRVKLLQPRKLLTEVAHLTRGMTCVDFGSGTGTFMLPMAEIAGPEGVVYAIDDSDEMLRRLRARGLPPNVVVIKADVANTGLKISMADFCLLSSILHELNEHDGLLKETRRLLKPGGQMLILEWKPDFDTPGPPKNIRLSPANLIERLSDLKFSNIEQRDWSVYHFVITARR